MPKCRPVSSNFYFICLAGFYSAKIVNRFFYNDLILSSPKVKNRFVYAYDKIRAKGVPEQALIVLIYCNYG